jgi:transcriptional regulator with XRE-family HTH domain
MQIPTSKTPVSKCLDLAAYSVRMLSKFPSNEALAPFAQSLQTLAQTLQVAQASYAEAVKAILPTRVDVKYEHFLSDRRIRLTQQKAEVADGKKGGEIANKAFPGGAAPIVWLVGVSQVNEMSDLAARLASLASVWPAAAEEAQAITKCCDGYKTAIEARQDAAQTANSLRAARDTAKAAFVAKYAEITSKVSKEFPRDTLMQELFFDDVRARSTAAQADEPGAELGIDEKETPPPA